MSESEPSAANIVAFWRAVGPDRWYEGTGAMDENLSARGAVPALRWFRVVDRFRKIAVEAKSERDFTLLRYPVETVSLSESGAETIHQGVCLRLLFPLSVRPQESDDYFLVWAVFSIAS